MLTSYIHTHTHVRISKQKHIPEAVQDLAVCLRTHIHTHAYFTHIHTHVRISGGQHIPEAVQDLAVCLETCRLGGFVNSEAFADIAFGEALIARDKGSVYESMLHNVPGEEGSTVGDHVLLMESMYENMLQDMPGARGTGDGAGVGVTGIGQEMGGECVGVRYIRRGLKLARRVDDAQVCDMCV